MLKQNIAFFILALCLPVVTNAQAAAGMIKGGIELTGYSANCAAYDGQKGGKDESPSGLKPRMHTVNGQSNLVLTAVPQSGGPRICLKSVLRSITLIWINTLVKSFMPAIITAKAPTVRTKWMFPMSAHPKFKMPLKSRLR